MVRQLLWTCPVRCLQLSAAAVDGELACEESQRHLKPERSLGAWGVVPVHLNELSPEGVGGTLPGFVYQFGNLFAAVNTTLQASITESHAGDYAVGLALVAGVTAIVIAVAGKEAKDGRFGAVAAVT